MPWVLFYSEQCSSRSDAMRREKEIKNKKAGNILNGQ
jgi:predicted GIY-YIG superfamily endonuclease